MKYWFIIDNQRIGPVEERDAVRLPLQPDTPVWHDGMPDWSVVGSIPEAPLLLGPKSGADTPPPLEPAGRNVADFGGIPVEYEEIKVKEESEAEPAPEAEAESRVEVEIPEIPAAAASAPVQASPTQAPPAPVEVPKCPNNYLVWNIVVTLLCCLPVGILGIIFASKVNPNYMTGNLEAARRWSERAEWCVIIAITCGFLSIPLQMLLSIITA